MRLRLITMTIITAANRMAAMPIEMIAVVSKIFGDGVGVGVKGNDGVGFGKVDGEEVGIAVRVGVGDVETVGAGVAVGKGEGVCVG